MTKHSIRPDSHSRVLYAAVIAFVVISLAAFALLIFSVVLQGEAPSILRDPMTWLRDLESSIAVEAVSNAAGLLAAVLAIAITVVAIVVELAANRYSHRITSLFVREPVNIIVMSFFVIATIQSIWVAVMLDANPHAAVLPNAGLLISMIMVTVSLILLLPYFAFVLSFLSPVSVIDNIRNAAIDAFRNVDVNSIEKSKTAIRDGVDELQDIARRAAELSDRAVAMASINALWHLLRSYQDALDELPDTWFRIDDLVAYDPDFVSISKTSIREIENDETWVEVKIMRQYLDLISTSNPSSRDITYLIAINTKQIGIAAINDRPQLVELCIHCFNSFLRATINNRDQRTSYYIMNQYRLLAEALLRDGKKETVHEIAIHFQFYGHLGFKMKMPFLLEVAAYDVVHLIEECVRSNSELVDDLLDLILELDQEIKEEFHEESLMGVRRAQIQLVAFFMENDDELRAQRICSDLKAEQIARLDTLRELLTTEDRPQYWEFTDRGVNFAYLQPNLRVHLDKLFHWIRQ